MAALLRTGTREGACIRFAWSDGFEAVFAGAWLLDNAAAVRGSGQRLRTAASLAAAGSIRAIEIVDDRVQLTFERETVEWRGMELRAYATRAGDLDTITLWPRGQDMAARPPIPYDAYLTDDAALKAALRDVARFGLVRLSGAGTDLCELERMVARFGFIRETNYGRLFDVRVEPDPSNLANTARALEPHTDNPYRDPVPTLQVLHGIRNSSEGGATVFLDGFALTAALRGDGPEDFARLAGHAVPFAFQDSAGNRYEAHSPIVRTTVEGRVAGIRFNHRALGAVDLGEAAKWYAAYLKFALAADAPERRLSFVLEPGDIVMFDNERILHGRESFAGPADRLLKGCYADRDALRATLARLDDLKP